MRRTEIQAIGQLAGEALAGGGSLVESMHLGIAERVFTHAPAPAPLRALHDGISRAVYAGVRGGLRAGAAAGARLAAQERGDDARSLDSRPQVALALGALNGIYGDHLAERTPGLALPMQARRRGRAVALTREGLARAYPDATSRVAVFVHGLCQTDDAWRIAPGGPQRGDRRSYGQRLKDELSYTPVFLRYNSGLHVSDNGRALAGLLDDLARHWPAGVEEIVLIGHSMGGLVARSACHYGERHGLPFTDSVRHLFCLGTPNLGAELEKGAHVLARALQQLPETRAVSRFLNARSAGIKDLRSGSWVEEGWHDTDPDEFLRDRAQEVPFLADVNYYFIGSTLTPGPLGRLIGDLLVRTPSSSGRGIGRGRRLSFEAGDSHQLPGINHFEILNHPVVYEQLRLWLTQGPRRRSAPAALPAPPAPLALLGDGRS